MTCIYISVCFFIICVRVCVVVVVVFLVDSLLIVGYMIFLVGVNLCLVFVVCYCLLN